MFKRNYSFIIADILREF